MEIDKKVENIQIFGPNTAGLAQRMYSSSMENNQLYVLRRSNILVCVINQF